jgi:hypothetical protein
LRSLRLPGCEHDLQPLDRRLDEDAPISVHVLTSEGRGRRGKTPIWAEVADAWDATRERVQLRNRAVDISVRRLKRCLRTAQFLPRPAPARLARSLAGGERRCTRFHPRDRRGSRRSTTWYSASIPCSGTRVWTGPSQSAEAPSRTASWLAP